MMTRREMEFKRYAIISKWTGVSQRKQWEAELQAYRAEMEAKLERTWDFCNYTPDCSICIINELCDLLGITTGKKQKIVYLQEQDKRTIINKIMED